MALDCYRPTQVREMDQRAFARGVASAALMDTAAGHLVRGILSMVGWRHYGLRVALLCGRGNNGGDGLAAGRRLLARGAAPVVWLTHPPDRLGPDAAREHAAYTALGGRVVATPEAALAGADVAVDCLLGTGASGEPRGPYATAVAALADFPGPVVACDLPTGVDADSGQVPGVAVTADLTVTLGAHKRGLWLWPARERCGRIVLGDLGIVDPDDPPAARVLEDADVLAAAPPPRPDAHKHARGVVVLLAGSPGMSGAAVLAARGALGAGAGLVHVATAEAVRRDVARALPEVLTLPLPEDPDAAFVALAGRLERADVLALGPGLGLAAHTQALVRRLVAEVEVPLVVDADGLNTFRGTADELAHHRAPVLVLTPHAKELTRLAGGGSRVHAERAERVPELAAAWRAVVVAKGPGTMVAAPDGRVWINATGSAALATGGTGDVLTGVTAALLAQRPDPLSVAAAVHVHGLAGELAAAGRSLRAVTAADVAAALGAAFGRIEGVR